MVSSLQSLSFLFGADFHNKLCLMSNKLKSSVSSDFNQGFDMDKIAGQNVQSETLKLIFETLLTLAYSLFIIGLTISLTVDTQTRDSFISYINQPKSAGFLIVLVILGVTVYSLGKASKKDKKYHAKTKRNINFIQDILRGIIFVLMIAYVASFVNQNSGKLEIIISFWLYIAATVMFTILHIIKWYHYCLGSAKGNLKPWTTIQHAEQFLDQNEKKTVKELANKAMKYGIAGGNVIGFLGSQPVRAGASPAPLEAQNIQIEPMIQPESPQLDSQRNMHPTKD